MNAGEENIYCPPLVLVAEDDDSNFLLIKAIISKKCEVLRARNGEELLKLFHEYCDRVEVILMDVKMPIMDGWEATRRVREENPSLPVIIQTAYAFSSDREKAMDCGASDVLVKPITLSALQTTMTKYVPRLTW